MSYSFGIRAATKADALKQIGDKLDNEVIATQPMHAKDRAVAMATAESVIDLVTLPDGFSYSISVNGSVGWNPPYDAPVADAVLNGAGVGVSVSLLKND